MLDTTRNIRSISAFRRSSEEFINELRRSQRPVVLTVKGKAAVVVQDAEAYQRLLDLAARADASEGIRQGLEQANRGEGRDIEEFFAEFELEGGLSG